MTNAIRNLKFIELKPSFIRKLWEQVNSTNRARELDRVGLDLKMFTFSN
ncbi:uncharacterized protein METZ01_LOCUS420026, partial [marine metagenome]